MIVTSYDDIVSCVPNTTRRYIECPRICAGKPDCGFCKDIFSIFNGNIDSHLANKEMFPYIGLYFLSKGDFKSSLYYLKMADQNNDSIGTFYLGIYYSIIDNQNGMLSYFQKAAKKGYSPAMIALGDFYMKENDFANMEEMYNLADKHHNMWGKISLAEYYESIDKDELALEIYLNSIKKFPFYKTIFKIGLLYSRNDDHDNAMKYYVKAEKYCDGCATNNIGSLIWNNSYDDVDITNAIKFYEKASKYGDPTAMKNLSNLYKFYGDDEKSKTYLNMAYENGYCNDAENSEYADEIENAYYNI